VDKRPLAISNNTSPVLRLMLLCAFAIVENPTVSDLRHLRHTRQLRRLTRVECGLFDVDGILPDYIQHLLNIVRRWSYHTNLCSIPYCHVVITHLWMGFLPTLGSWDKGRLKSWRTLLKTLNPYKFNKLTHDARAIPKWTNAMFVGHFPRNNL
jgi:hypothetical protein